MALFCLANVPTGNGSVHKFTVCLNKRITYEKLCGHKKNFLSGEICLNTNTIILVLL
jgi:glyceraldehyde-3-phosphate dehydrogenase/erythrose-4-phosphate dehydrogenase